GTLYTFEIFPLMADNRTEGHLNSTSIYTNKYLKCAFFKLYISSHHPENISTDQVTLTWQNNDTAASNYTYVISTVGNGIPPNENQTSQNNSALIVGLQPGTPYDITIYALAADNQTEGTSADIRIYTTVLFLSSVTRPSPMYIHLFVKEKTLHVVIMPPALCSGLYISLRVIVWGCETFGSVFNSQVISFGSTELNVTWQINGIASLGNTYKIAIIPETNISHANNQTFQTRNNTAVIEGLQPGTPYNITIYPLAADNKTKGDSNVIYIYTRPSPVFDIKPESISTNQVNLTWQNNDTAASTYTYVISTVENGTFSARNQTSRNNISVIEGLQPGTLYNITIYPLAADNQTEGNSADILISTDAASVSGFICTPVTKEPKLMLKWDCPNGTYSNFSINIVGDGRNNKTVFLHCNQTEIITDLNYYTSYNVSITTHSSGEKSPPVQKTCTTSITDPPVPIKEPTIAAVTHNSFKVIFSAFESKNGPLKAYAIMITTAKEGNEPPNSSLKYTYSDFKEGKTKTYVTYVLVVEQMRASSFPSNSSQYEQEVGNKESTYGYYNAPLDPLGSYRVCVAGFTKIEFNESERRSIVERRSYVSFMPYSHAISLPQDPGVITGAVLGCILVAVVITSLVGFVFWRRRRKDGKHNDLSFSQIRSKLIRVENFESYFKKQQADSNCGFAEEYEELRPVGVHQPKFAAELVENRGKNRYNNVLPYDISRVKLLIQNHPTDDYINANYMPGYNSKKEFIAAQGPLPNTLQDFWRMIWEKNIYAIVMLTKCVEQGRTKCEEYWPEKGTRDYGNVTVTLISEFVLPEWTIRDFSVEDTNATESHPVRQFHFTSWPDHGVPETTDLLINFRHLVQESMRQNPPDSPTLVHCSAGVGRTGTFIAIDRLIQQMEMENTSDVYGVVYDLRMHRPLMVQTEDQYIFLNQCVLDIIKSQKDKKPDLIYQNTTAMAIYENFAPTPSFEKANGYHA
uniref:Receptor-type tyrosine-protein phosphatase eta n=1 Tax=Pelusios castaneus TaxID=367368 RepID=A0A8C8SNJ2_9SAUR